MEPLAHSQLSGTVVPVDLTIELDTTRLWAMVIQGMSARLHNYLLEYQEHFGSCNTHERDSTTLSFGLHAFALKASVICQTATVAEARTQQLTALASELLDCAVAKLQEQCYGTVRVSFVRDEDKWLDPAACATDEGLAAARLRVLKALVSEFSKLASPKAPRVSTVCTHLTTLLKECIGRQTDAKGRRGSTKWCVQLRLAGEEYAPPPEFLAWLTDVVATTLLTPVHRGGVSVHAVKGLAMNVAKRLPALRKAGAMDLWRDYTDLHLCPLSSLQSFQGDLSAETCTYIGNLASHRHPHVSGGLDSGMCRSPSFLGIRRSSDQRGLVMLGEDGAPINPGQALELALDMRKPLHGRVTVFYRGAPIIGPTFDYDLRSGQLHITDDSPRFVPKVYVKDPKKQREQAPLPQFGGLHVVTDKTMALDKPKVKAMWTPRRGADPLVLGPRWTALLARGLAKVDIDNKFSHTGDGGQGNMLLSIGRYVALTWEYWQNGFTPLQVDHFSNIQFDNNGFKGVGSVFFFDSAGQVALNSPSLPAMVELLENSWASLLYYQPAFCFACERMLMFAARMVKSRCIEAIFRHLENFFKANPGLYVMIDEIRRRYPTGHPVPNVAPASAKFYFDTNVYDFNVVLTWMLPMLAIYKNQAHVRGSKTVLSSNRLNNAMRYLRGFLLARKMAELCLLVALVAAEKVDDRLAVLIEQHGLQDLSDEELCKALLGEPGTSGLVGGSAIGRTFLFQSSTSLGDCERPDPVYIPLADKEEGRYAEAAKLEAKTREPGVGRLKPNHTRMPPEYAKNPRYPVAARLSLSITRRDIEEGRGAEHGYGIFANRQEMLAYLDSLSRLAGEDAMLSFSKPLRGYAANIISSCMHFASLMSDIPRRKLSYEVMTVGELYGMVRRLVGQPGPDGNFETPFWMPNPAFVEERGFLNNLRGVPLPDFIASRTSAAMTYGLDRGSVSSSITEDFGQALKVGLNEGFDITKPTNDPYNDIIPRGIEQTTLNIAARPAVKRTGTEPKDIEELEVTRIDLVIRALEKPDDVASDELRHSNKMRASRLRKFKEEARGYTDAREFLADKGQSGLILMHQAARDLDLGNRVHTMFNSDSSKRAGAYGSQPISFTGKVAVVLAHTTSYTCQDPRNQALGVFGTPIERINVLGVGMSEMMGIVPSEVGILPTPTVARAIGISLLRILAHLTEKELDALCHGQGHSRTIQMMYYALRTVSPEALFVTATGQHMLSPDRISRMIAEASKERDWGSKEDEEEIAEIIKEYRSAQQKAQEQAKEDEEDEEERRERGKETNLEDLDLDEVLPEPQDNQEPTTLGQDDQPDSEEVKEVQALDRLRTCNSKEAGCNYTEEWFQKRIAFARAEAEKMESEGKGGWYVMAIKGHSARAASEMLLKNEKTEAGKQAIRNAKFTYTEEGGKTRDMVLTMNAVWWGDDEIDVYRAFDADTECIASYMRAKIKELRGPTATTLDKAVWEKLKERLAKRSASEKTAAEIASLEKGQEKANEERAARKAQRTPNKKGNGKGAAAREFPTPPSIKKALYEKRSGDEEDEDVDSDEPTATPVRKRANGSQSSKGNKRARRK